MRIVRALADLTGEIAAAEAEAASAFGDGTVFVEPYVERGRHVEVQVVGHARVYGDRDCSMQRRHQKVVEEAPAPGLRDEVRAALHDAARTAAEAIDYRGAGTVEFLYDPATERFCFLEMNTRLQVEHPVTELVHGVDLVELQLAAAEARLDDGLARPAATGHAIEVRLYAEDPAADYQPQSGVLTTVRDPGRGRASGSTPASSPAARCRRTTTRCWPRSIAHAPTREAGRAQAGRRPVAGADPRRCVTNRDLLVAILRDERFLAGEVSAPTFLDALRGSPVADLDRRVAPVAAAIALAERAGAARTVQRGIPVAWRNVVSQPQVTEFEGGVDGRVVGRPRRLRPSTDAAVVAASPTSVALEVGRRPHDVRRARSPATSVDVDWPGGHVRAAGVRRGSSTRPTRWRAAACWRRCPAPSSASRSSRASRSRPASRCSSSRR